MKKIIKNIKKLFKINKKKKTESYKSCCNNCECRN